MRPMVKGSGIITLVVDGVVSVCHCNLVSTPVTRITSVPPHLPEGISPTESIPSRTYGPRCECPTDRIRASSLVICCC
jgi:hypothetical protein